MKRGNDMKKLGSKLSNACSFKVPDFLSSAIFEEKLSFGPYEPAAINQLHIGAVDGGLVTSNLAGFDVLGLKAVGVYLNYGKERIRKVRYFPNKHQDIAILPVFKNFNKVDFDTIYSSYY